MAKAGYDPAQALEFWKRMMTKDKKAAKMPEFMSTHPNDASRLKELQEFLPEARKYYIPPQTAQGPLPPGRPHHQATFQNGPQAFRLFSGQ
jgi:predicted Zn-dependent protease